MTIQLTERQAELLLELLEVEHREQIHGLHHTLTSDYKKLLKERIAEIEKLAELLRTAEHAIGA